VKDTSAIQCKEAYSVIFMKMQMTVSVQREMFSCHAGNCCVVATLHVKYILASHCKDIYEWVEAYYCYQTLHNTKVYYGNILFDFIIKY
jgi:hypothetical protein